MDHSQAISSPKESSLSLKHGAVCAHSVYGVYQAFPPLHCRRPGTREIVRFSSVHVHNYILHINPRRACTARVTVLGL